MQFKLEIETGNEAMQNEDDIARALEDLAVWLQGTVLRGPGGDIVVNDGVVRDRNGNTVGRWEVVEEDTPTVHWTSR